MSLLQYLMIQNSFCHACLLRKDQVQRARTHTRTHARTHASIYNRKNLESLNIVEVTHIIYKYIFFKYLYINLIYIFKNKLF